MNNWDQRFKELVDALNTFLWIQFSCIHVKKKKKIILKVIWEKCYSVSKNIRFYYEDYEYT